MMPEYDPEDGHIEIIEEGEAATSLPLGSNHTLGVLLNLALVNLNGYLKLHSEELNNAQRQVLNDAAVRITTARSILNALFDLGRDNP